MGRKLFLCLLAMKVLFCLAPVTWGQRGMGDTSGVVRQGLKLETVTLKGKVVHVDTGPCAKGTGRSVVGTHFILRSEQDLEQNIHLGPAQWAQQVTDQLTEGKIVTVCAFRTQKMPPGHYNAVSVTIDDKTMHLRHQNLRPVWAGQAPQDLIDLTELDGPVVGITVSVCHKRLTTVKVISSIPVAAGALHPRELNGKRSRGRKWGRRCCGGRYRFGMRRRAWR